MTHKILGLLLFQWILSTSSLTALSQRPREIQVDNPPPDMTDIPTLIFIIGLPIILVLGYVFLRKRKGK